MRTVQLKNTPNLNNSKQNNNNSNNYKRTSRSRKLEWHTTISIIPISYWGVDGVSYSGSSCSGLVDGELGDSLLSPGEVELPESGGVTFVVSESTERLDSLSVERHLEQI